MAASVFDSALFSRLFPTGEVGRLFTDTAELRAMLLVEGMLAKVQGEQGIIPELSAAAISRAAMEVQLDPGALAHATGQNGVSVPALVAAFRSEMQAPEHAQYAHWGATSQDIIDTGLMLRLRQALGLIEKDIVAALDHLAQKAEDHADTPMPARTYGQHATPTSFGAVVASWGEPLLGLLGELPDLRRSCLLVSLSGAAGTASALGPQAAETRAALAKLLNLTNPERSWHTDRTPVLRIADWCSRIALAFGKMGEDATELVQSGISELSLGGGGSSSTMPQKQNPVAPSVLVALSRQTSGLMPVLQSAAMHRHQRDGAAWFTEWMCLPQIILGAASAAQTGLALCEGLAPNPEQMRAALNGSKDLIHAEALSFALANHLSRPDAQAATKALCKEAIEADVPLRTLVARDWPQLNTDVLFDPAHQMGQAPTAARTFAKQVRSAAKT
ncbi:class-II fumarase/aspartase family protein [Falsiruegeria mediterranea]|uniref:3-carboxy-cis,cis-muconate cycloisomerase n=1 Tax=Falsiruegeria mediterranea M17 TaxID=1200281 RepID=A0A2R8C9X7_9RHOB|nr:adenylosuccinate lyase family protein [Falsiruegeria mediterranea]SPJ29146.1 3-carboxy-cis,cis-muconate cycloisomerase [Falsiruegeria mediterranea M17]